MKAKISGSVNKKILAGNKDARILLNAQPLREKLMGRPLKMLDFGSGDRMIMVGVSAAIMSIIRPKELRAIGISAEACGGAREGGGDIDANGNTLSFRIIEPFLLGRDNIGELREKTGISEFDICLLSDPELAYDVRRAVLISMLYESGLPVCLPPELENLPYNFRLEEMTPQKCMRLIREYLHLRGIDVIDLGRVSWMRLSPLIETACLEIPLKYVFPKVLAPNGVVLIRINNGTPISRVEEVLGKNGYELLMDVERPGREGFPISDPRANSTHLIGAVISPQPNPAPFLPSAQN